MSKQIKKKFWEATSVVKQDSGFAVFLDDRPLKTQMQNLMVLDFEEIASWVADEWDVPEEKLDLENMPATRLASAVLDKVRDHRDNMIADLAGYAGTDLLCYRANGPKELVQKQQEAWDPILEWAEENLNSPLAVTQGVIPVDQPKDSLKNLRAPLDGLNHYQLAAVHELVSISGSLVLTHAFLANQFDVKDAWDRSRIDESWQIALWGSDEEAEAVASRKYQAFCFAAKFLLASE